VQSFADLAARLDAAALALNGSLTPVGEFEGYPQLKLVFGSKSSRQVLVDAGIHGEEPGAPLGLAAWLEADGARWASRLGFTVLPCLNPWGFERGTRNSRDLEDPNRHFDEPDSPLTALVARALEGRRFALACDLHEDVDFLGAYLYELKAAPPFAGERILEAISAHVPLSNGDEVGDFRTVRGLIRPPAAMLRPTERRGWPIAFFHFANAADHLVTPETPGRQPLPARIAAQRSVLDLVCAFVLEGSGPRLPAGTAGA